ncbi:MAG TPA: hypothetical protein GXX48_19910, partial [Ochrobactrum intermedium]|nr:hypothetical protein [Brucella intermedia]
LALEPVENALGLFLAFASRPAAFPYARLLALAHALPALGAHPETCETAFRTDAR